MLSGTLLAFFSDLPQLNNVKKLSICCHSKQKQLSVTVTFF